MRSHLYRCLEEGKMALFPLKKERRALSKIVAVDFIEVHCICRFIHWRNGGGAPSV